MIRRGAVVLRPLYFNLGNPPVPLLPTLAPIPDAKLPHFSILTASRCIDDRARMVMQSRAVSHVSYTATDLRRLNVLMEFLWVSMDRLDAISRSFYELL